MAGHASRRSSTPNHTTSLHSTFCSSSSTSKALCCYFVLYCFVVLCCFVLFCVVLFCVVLQIELYFSTATATRFAVFYFLNNTSPEPVDLIGTSTGMMTFSVCTSKHKKVLICNASKLRRLARTKRTWQRAWWTLKVNLIQQKKKGTTSKVNIS